MIKLKHLLVFTLIVCSFSCNNKQGNTFAIKDFRNSLQPFLTEIVVIGMVTYHDSSKMKGISDDELIRLSRSDNPILRATAFNECLDRKTFNQFEIIMNNLSDTAFVNVDHGEFGVAFLRVSDYVLEQAHWKSKQARKETIDDVLLKHNYLRSAFTILSHLEPQGKYYSAVKDMATRPRWLDIDGYEMGFPDIEYALYGLARFEKKEDVQFIINKLTEHLWQLSGISFRLMKEFPDPLYFPLLEKYHRLNFYQFSGNRPGGFTGGRADKASPEDFIQALVAQKNERSAELLDSMLSILPRCTCMPDKESIIVALIREIWDHPCPAYLYLREKIKSKAEKISKIEINFPTIARPITVDTMAREFNWFDYSTDY